MISRIFVKKIKKSCFGKKDSFTIIDIAPKEYYKLSNYDKLFFTQKIMGFKKVLENIKPHDSIDITLPDGTLCKNMVGDEFVYSLSMLYSIYEKMLFGVNKEEIKYSNILLKIIKNAEKTTHISRIIFVMEKN